MRNTQGLIQKVRSVHVFLDLFAYIVRLNQKEEVIKLLRDIPSFGDE